MVQGGERPVPGDFFGFFVAVQGAIAQAEVQAVARVNAASQADWWAAAWWLERGPARARWRPSVHVRVEDLSDAEIQAALDQVARRLAGAGGAAAGGDDSLDD